MNQCKQSKDLFDEALCKELNKEQKLFLENHLRECPKCRSEFQEANAMLNFMKKRVRQEPEPAFWDGYWERLRDRMEKENLVHARSEKKRKTFFQFFQFLNFSPRWVVQAAAAVVLVVIGIFIGREIFPPSSTAGPGKQIDQPPVFTSRFEPGTELFQRTHNFIERSKVILLAMVNFDPKTEDAYVLNLPYQQRISRELVQQASGLKNQLSNLQQRQLRELITDLEVILLQVANLESGSDISAIELVKNGVKIRGVLFKIQLTDIRQSINKKSKTKRI
ncbi:MAG: zf-HC2 domain-containing protein [Candidatus Aminicenantes bacterium]|nr:MAG: zf-HC2 domain-containing protein [Candidatus Aminicenantes bacterium]